MIDMRGLLLFMIVFLMAGCSSYEDTQKLTRKSRCVSYSFDDSRVTINFGWEPGYDTLNACEIIGGSYIYPSPLKIKAKYNGATLIKAEKAINWYPTIWSSPDDDCIQLVYLFDLYYQEIKKLEIKDGYILYPSEVEMGKGAKVFFSNLDRQQLINGIEKIPIEYNRKDTLSAYEHSSWADECQKWKKKIDGYKKGMFVNECNEPFSVCPFEIYLVITFQNEHGTFTKVLRDEFIAGN